MLLEKRFPKRKYGRRSITATRQPHIIMNSWHCAKNSDPVTSLTNELYAIFMCHLMAGSQEAVKYTKLPEDVKKAPKSEGLHILLDAYDAIFAGTGKGCFFTTVTRFISVPGGLVADGFQKTHYEDPYESMAEKMVNLHLQMESVRQRIQKAKRAAAQTNVDGGILFTHWGCKARSELPA